MSTKKRIVKSLFVSFFILLSFSFLVSCSKFDFKIGKYLELLDVTITDKQARYKKPEEKIDFEDGSISIEFYLHILDWKNEPWVFSIYHGNWDEISLTNTDYLSSTMQSPDLKATSPSRDTYQKLTAEINLKPAIDGDPQDDEVVLFFVVYKYDSTNGHKILAIKKVLESKLDTKIPEVLV
jgi:hypothetical protein